MSNFDLTSRVAIVTGAGRGLGRSHALALAAAGASVVVNDLGVSLDGRDQPTTAAEQVAEEVRAAGGRAIADATDITSDTGGEALVDRALSEFGRLDILVNNAGILRDRSAHKMSMEEVDAVMNVHLRGAFNLTLPAYRHMREASYGRIVVTTSASGLLGNFGQLNYGAAKAALLGFVKVLAIEASGRDIKVNAISPVASTRMTYQEFGDLAKLFPPEFVSQMVLYLCAEGCDPTGEIFSVGGGQISRIFVGLTEGIFRSDGVFTPEEIDRAMAPILATSGFSTPVSMAGEWDKIMALHGIQGTSAQ